MSKLAGLSILSAAIDPQLGGPGLRIDVRGNAPGDQATLWTPSRRMSGGVLLGNDVLSGGSWGAFQEGGGQQARKIVGQTKDSVGTGIPSLVKAYLTATDTYVSQVMSDAAGYFEICTQYPEAHYLVCYRAGSPNLAGTSVNNLVPTEGVVEGSPTLPTVGTAPTLWLRADLGLDVSTEGAAVGTWANQQGTAGSAIQATANNKPTLELAGLGGRPCLRFLNTSFPQHMVGTIALTGAAHTFFMVCNLDAHSAGNKRLVSFPAGGTNDISANDWILYDPNAGNDIAVFRDVTAGSVMSGVTAAANHVLMARFDGANSTSAVDGTAGTTVADTTAKLAAKYSLAGGQNASAFGYLTTSLRIAEVLEYQAALSSPDVATILAYLKTRYSIP